MPVANITLKPFRVEDFLSRATLSYADMTVTEIFGMMFSLEAEVVETASPDPRSSSSDELTAIVGFSGAMRGACHIRMTSEAARSITSAMLGGVPVDENDDSINDALGELCNMLAGGWKNRVPGLSSECTLSPPTVISGQNYKVHLSKPSVRIIRSYQFGAHSFHLMLCYEEIETPHAK